MSSRICLALVDRLGGVGGELEGRAADRAHDLVLDVGEGGLGLGRLGEGRRRDGGEEEHGRGKESRGQGFSHSARNPASREVVLRGLVMCPG